MRLEAERPLSAAEKRILDGLPEAERKDAHMALSPSERKSLKKAEAKLEAAKKKANDTGVTVSTHMESPEEVNESDELLHLRWEDLTPETQKMRKGSSAHCL